MENPSPFPHKIQHPPLYYLKIEIALEKLCRQQELGNGGLVDLCRELCHELGRKETQK